MPASVPKPGKSARAITWIWRGCLYLCLSLALAAEVPLSSAPPSPRAAQPVQPAAFALQTGGWVGVDSYRKQLEQEQTPKEDPALAAQRALAAAQEIGRQIHPVLLPPARIPATIANPVK